MESLLRNEGTSSDSNKDLRSSICYYLSIIVILLCFIMSMISLGFCSYSTIQSKLYNYEFPTWDHGETFAPGTPVHINRNGLAFPGAGTTIYRNITNAIITRAMKNVKIRELDFNIAIAVYDGGIDIYKFNFDGYAMEALHRDLPETIDGRDRQVDDVVRVSRSRFIVVGSRELLPLTATVERNFEKHEEKVSITFGNKMRLENDDDMWPHVDNLSNSTFALVYENGNELYTRWGTWRGDGEDAKLDLQKETLATKRYEYHGVAGMDSKHFIIAATGMQFNVSHSMPIVTAALCTIQDDDSIVIGDWVTLPFQMSHNFFDMDNMGPNEVIMVFSSMEGGVNAVVMKYDREGSTIMFGAQEQLQTGGAILHENKIDLRVLNYNTFAVFYQDNAINSLNLILCDISESDDIYVVSPTYVVSRPRGFERTEYSFDLCEIGMGDFAIIEYSNSGPESRVMIHRGDITARMFGVVSKAKKDKLTVQFAGMFKVPGSRKLTPGRAIFTNSKGELIEGQPYGYANREFGQFYTESFTDNSILSLSNLIGVAVTKKKIYLKYVWCVCLNESLAVLLIGVNTHQLSVRTVNDACNLQMITFVEMAMTNILSKYGLKRMRGTA